MDPQATVKLDWREIERKADELWRRWDPDGSGGISMNEMMTPSTGLLAYLSQHYPGAEVTKEPPDLRKKPREWFTFWCVWLVIL